MYNKEYAWFDKLDDQERKLFFNFLIGHLNLTPEKLRKIYEDFQNTSLVEFQVDEDNHEART